MDPRPIGVFDSGVGGLTVLNALLDVMPFENYLYLGDTARLPYGTKSSETVINYSLRGCQALLEHNIKMLVIACNSISSWALPTLQKKWPHILLEGVIHPTVKAAIQASKSGQFFLLATETTLQSQQFPTLIHEELPKASILEQAAPLLVPLAEEGWVSGHVPSAVLQQYLSPFFSSEQKPDCIILGCTHYPVFLKEIREIIGSETTLIDSASPTARAVYHRLLSNNLFNTLDFQDPEDLHRKTAPSASAQGKIQYLVTDAPDRFERAAKIFLPTASLHTIQKIDL